MRGMSELGPLPAVCGWTSELRSLPAVHVRTGHVQTQILTDGMRPHWARPNSDPYPQRVSARGTSELEVGAAESPILLPAVIGSWRPCSPH